MSFNEILEQLPKLTEDEKRQLWNILDQQLADEGRRKPGIPSRTRRTYSRFGSWCTDLFA